MSEAPWFVLGFTAEDITVCWQHWRLAMDFHRAFEAEGLPPSFGVVEAVGEGDFILHWYVSVEAARVLDRHDVSWRRFIVSEAMQTPADAHPALSGIGHVQP